MCLNYHINTIIIMQTNIMALKQDAEEKISGNDAQHWGPKVLNWKSPLDYILSCLPTVEAIRVKIILNAHDFLLN